MLDLTKLTLGEIAKIEELGGVPITKFAGKGVPIGKPMAAVAFVAARRNGNPITWNAALALDVDEASAIIGLDADDDDEVAKLNQMTKAHLLEYAAEHDITVTATRLAEIRAEIAAAIADKSEDEDDPTPSA